MQNQENNENIKSKRHVKWYTVITTHLGYKLILHSLVLISQIAYGIFYHLSKNRSHY